MRACAIRRSSSLSSRSYLRSYFNLFRMKIIGLLILVQI